MLSAMILRKKNSVKLLKTLKQSLPKNPNGEATTKENMVQLCETIWWTIQTNMDFELTWGHKNDSL